MIFYYVFIDKNNKPWIMILTDDVASVVIEIREDILSIIPW
jgi:hypothetical protein